MKPMLTISCTLLMMVTGAFCFTLTYDDFLKRAHKRIENTADLADYFPKSVDEVNAYVKYTEDFVRKAQQAIIKIPDAQRTFANTMHAYDVTYERLSRVGRIMLLYSMVMPDEALCKAAGEAYVKILQLAPAVLDSHPMYVALKFYVDHQGQVEPLNAEECYFIREVIREYEHVGLNLEPKDLAVVEQLKKKIVQLKFAFRNNIWIDHKSLLMTRADLDGVSKRIIDGLQKQGDLYVVTTDYPVYHAIMNDCKVEKTREQLYLAFLNRAYPINQTKLEQLLDARNQLATKLGASDFATWSLAEETARTPAYAESFIKALAKRAEKKTTKEFALLRENLPDEVTLDGENKIKPWDYHYLVSLYNKQNAQLSMRTIEQYFPLPHVLNCIMEAFHQFLGLSFKIIKPRWVWHPHVMLVEVRDDATKQLQGYLFLDLYPRKKKYTHAMHASLILPFSGLHHKTKLNPALAVLVMNLPSPQGSKPALLTLKGLKTLMHELGHAVHGLLSRPQMAHFAGTKVKRDFVEVPSQFFESWIKNPTFLKKIALHYRTNESIPSSLVDKIIAMRLWDSGYRMRRSCWLSLTALHYHTDEWRKGLGEVSKLLYQDLIDTVAFDERTHMYASFGHLGSLGPKYYSYLWARVIASDLFATVQKKGLFNATVGKQFADAILRPGGSVDPIHLVNNYLGRPSKLSAFSHALALR